LPVAAEATENTSSKRCELLKTGHGADETSHNQDFLTASTEKTRKHSIS